MEDGIFQISSILHIETSNINFMLPITKDTPIEDLIEQLPLSVSYLREKGIVCIVCGEPVWGTVNEIAKQKNFSNEDIEQIVNELNHML